MWLNGKQGLRRYIGPKRAVLALLFAGIIFYVRLLHQQGELSFSVIEDYRNGHPVMVVFLFIMFYAASLIAALPTLPFNLAGGYFWGGLLGGIYSAIAVTLGGWGAFCLARALMGKPLAKHFDNRWAEKVRREFERSGWKFIAFARLNPVIPTGPLNYLLGLTSTSHVVFLWVTFTFLLPPSIAVAYLGENFRTFVADDMGVNSVIRTVLFASGAVTLLASLKFASKLLHTEDPSYENHAISDDAQRSARHESYHAKDRSVVG